MTTCLAECAKHHADGNILPVPQYMFCQKFRSANMVCYGRINMACKLAKPVSFSKCDHFLLSRAQKCTAPCALCYLLHTVRLVRSRSKTKQVAGRSSFSWVGFYVMSTIPEVKWKIKMPTIRKMSRNSSQTFFLSWRNQFQLEKSCFSNQC